MRQRPWPVLGPALAVLSWLVVAWFFIRQGRTWDAAWLDVGIYREAAQTFTSGGDVYIDKFGGEGGGLPFTYPPFALVVLAPLAFVGPGIAVAAVFGLSVICLVACVRWCEAYTRPDLRDPWWFTVLVAGLCAVLVEPVRTTLGLGQINIVLLALVLGIDARATRAAGVGAGIAAAIKVTPALLVAAQLARLDLKAFARGVAAFLVCTGIAAFFAFDETRQYFGELIWQSDRPGNLAYVGNQSLRGLWERMAPGQAGVLWALSVVLILIIGVVVVYRHRADPWLALTAAGIAGLLISPVSWSHHWVWVLPVMAVGVRNANLRSPVFWVSAALLAASIAGLDAFWMGVVAPSVFLNSFVLLGSAWLVVLAVSRTPAASTTTAATSTAP